MRVVLFTQKGFESNELFRYLHARIAGQFPDCAIVAVQAEGQRLALRLRRYWKKARRLGVRQMIEITSSYPLQAYYMRRHQRERDLLLRQLARPHIAIDQKSVTIVKTVNGADAVEAIRGLRPDILVQAGAGILKPEIFRISRIACLNVHHGIAPLVRGMNSIYWGLWENRPEWIGATVHEVDAGIDTGNVLAYAPVRQAYPGEPFPPLFVRASERGVDRLLEVMARLEAGERWKISASPGPSVYRSTMSGWKLARLEWRLKSQRARHATALRRQAAQL